MKKVTKYVATDSVEEALLSATDDGFQDPAAALEFIKKVHDLPATRLSNRLKVYVVTVEEYGA